MNSKTKIMLGCICIVFGLSLSGCNSNLIDSTIASVTASPSPTVSATAPPAHDVVNVILPIEQPVVTPTPTQNEINEPTATKSSDQATVASNTVQLTNPAEAKNKSVPEFNSKQPEIIGLAIGEDQEKAIAKHGKPLESYIMEDPAEPITVYQYDGFSIGFNADNQIQFIDISSVKVNPGLGGLRIGQTTNQALEALGKPDKNTSYVISYNTKTAILKLDIDPKTKTIQSIKLFGVNES